MFIQVLGIDLGKSNFHIVGHDCAGKTVVRKKLSRKQLIVFFSNSHPLLLLLKPVAVHIGLDVFVSSLSIKSNSFHHSM